MGAGREPDTDPERLADELDEQADELRGRSEHLEEKVIEVRREWEQKRSDPNVPGADPPAEEEKKDDESVQGEDQGPETPPW
jgi:hypothetical protein